MTTGNLSRHISELVEAGCVLVEKEFEGKKPHTVIQLTEKEREKFSHYNEIMKQMVTEQSNSQS